MFDRATPWSYAGSGCSSERLPVTVKQLLGALKYFYMHMLNYKQTCCLYPTAFEGGGTSQCVCARFQFSELIVSVHVSYFNVHVPFLLVHVCMYFSFFSVCMHIVSVCDCLSLNVYPKRPLIPLSM